MTTATPKLDDFLHNPEDLPADPDELAKLVLGDEGNGEDDTASQSNDTDDGGKGGEGGENADAATDDKGGEAKGGQGASSDANGEKPDGVLTRDGKHVIPYAVLEAERTAKANAERIAQEASERTRQLEEQLRLAAAGKSTDDPAKGAQETKDLLQQIDELTEEVPALRDLLKPMAKTITSLQAQVNDLTHHATVIQNERATSTQEAVQQAIDRNPYLRYWQAEDQAAFDRAVALDTVARADPSNKHLSFDERFEKVVSAMHAMYGKAELPEAYRPRQQSSNSGKGDDKERTEANGKGKAKDESFTLSDLPGGASPNRDDRRFDEMSVNELADKIDGQLDRGVPMDQILAQFG